MIVSGALRPELNMDRRHRAILRTVYTSMQSNACSLQLHVCVVVKMNCWGSETTDHFDRHGRSHIHNIYGCAAQTSNQGLPVTKDRFLRPQGSVVNHRF